MAAAINQNPQGINGMTNEIPFVDRHFTKIAFVIAAFVHFVISPLFIFIGSAASLAAHWYFQPELRLGQDEQIITVSHAIFAIVGATAALISILPAGALGGVVFQLVPFLSDFAIGSVVYRAARAF